MYALIKSSVSGTMYQSVVYGLIGMPLRFITYSRHSKEFELVDQYRIRDSGLYDQLVYMIQKNNAGFEWFSEEKIRDFIKYCKDNGRTDIGCTYICGFPDVCGNYDFLCDLCEKRRADAENYDIKLRSIPDADVWKYIKTQNDAEEFMNLFFGFHDSILKSISFVSDNDNIGFSAPCAVAVFSSTWYGDIELCFEGVYMLKLASADNDLCIPSSLDEASLFADEQGVFWADSYLETSDEEYKGSIIKAMSLKWRDKKEEQKL